MTEKPILFNTEMVMAILDGRKTQTRRFVKPHLPNRVISNISYGTFPGAKRSDWIINYEGEITNYFGHVKPPYQVGDILWVRETWCELVKEHIIDGQKYAYKANTGSDSDRCRREYIECGYPYQWRPSIHMPRAAARLFLRVTNVRVERLQDITEDDAMAEGVDCLDDACWQNNVWVPTYYDPDSGGGPVFRDGFAALWDSIYSKQGQGWEANPWVWVIEFERCETNG